jgi:hypothetical protein
VNSLLFGGGNDGFFIVVGGGARRAIHVSSNDDLQYISFRFTTLTFSYPFFGYVETSQRELDGKPSVLEHLIQVMVWVVPLGEQHVQDALNTVRQVDVGRNETRKSVPIDHGGESCCRSTIGSIGR